MGGVSGRFMDEWETQRYFHEEITRDDWPWVFGATSNRLLSNGYAYVAFKLLEALFITGVLGWSLYDRFVNIDCGDKYLIYLTHWSLVLQVYYVWISLVAAYRASFPSMGVEMPMSVGVSWVLSDILQPLTCLVCVLYWVFVHPHQRGTPGSLTYLTHGANFLVMMLDAFIASVPHYLLHGAYFGALCLGYLLLTLLYWVAGGTDCSGNSFIFKVLDWSHPGNLETMQGISLFLVFPVLNLLTRFAESQCCPSDYRLADQDGGAQAAGWLSAHQSGFAGRKRGGCGFCCARK